MSIYRFNKKLKHNYTANYIARYPPYTIMPIWNWCYFTIAKEIKAACVNEEPSWELFYTHLVPLQLHYETCYDVFGVVITELKKMRVDFTHHLKVYRSIQRTRYEEWFTYNGTFNTFYQTFLPPIQATILNQYYHLDEEEYLLSLPFHELKTRVFSNHYPVENIRNPHYKCYWVKAYIHTKKWGFNTFAKRILLPDDLLHVIRRFI